MKKVAITVVTIFFLLSCIGISVAGQKATEAECVAKCKEAAALVKEKGLNAAIAVVGDKSGPFVWKDTYVFAIDTEKKTVVAHPIKPGLVGKKLIGIKDVNGKMFFAEFIKVANSKGEGWVSYMWPKPGEKKPSPKKTYVYKVPGESIAMLAGIYE